MSAEVIERRLVGVAASGGVGIGRVRVVGRLNLPPPREVLPEERQTEVLRLREAVKDSEEELRGVRDELARTYGEEHGVLLDAHLLMHRDALFVGAAEERILKEADDAEHALVHVGEALRAKLAQAESVYLRERAADVQYVTNQILQRLVGELTRPLSEDENVVLIAHELGPADAFRWMSGKVGALVTELGSPASHTALLARTMGIPAIVAVPRLLDSVVEHEEAIVDGFTGQVTLTPSELSRQRGETRRTRHLAFLEELKGRGGGPGVTADDRPVRLRVNLEMVAEASLLPSSGADGVGLFRTEFLFLDRRTAPDEDEQAAAYSEVVRTVAPMPVTFRTIDIGGDKVPGGGLSVGAPNPLLGLRGLRLSLARAEVLLRPQLRALLRSSTHGPVRIMFPVVADVGDFRRGRDWVLRCADELRTEGQDIGEVQVGAMVEVPAAALGAESLAREADFLSLGTNDLSQYVLAADRSNPAVGACASSLHPALVQLIHLTCQACERAGVPLSLCGDMGADPLALPLVIGLGIEELSVPVGMLPLVREIVGRIDSKRAAGLVASALSLTTASEVEARIREGFGGALGDIWQEYGLGESGQSTERP